MDSGDSSNWTLIRRLLALSWRYRSGCIKVFALQVILLTVGVGGLGLTGLGIDYVRHQVQPGANPPRWPLAMLTNIRATVLLPPDTKWA